MTFMDRIAIKVRAGAGGDGIVSFAAGKYQPKMGPDGGDGGNGGSVILRGTTRLNTLSSLRYQALYKAEDGAKGGIKNCRGRSGDNFEIQLPLGTMIFDQHSGTLLGELLYDDQTIEIAKGGRRGLGNVHWLTSTHQAPEEFRPGAAGEERDLKLELKLLADVGLAGFPNAGKSTILSCISAAKPKIADYPFTTLVPNLGVVELGSPGKDYFGDSFVVADVPGLIEGASMGRGLGHEFLRHLERTSVIAYILDASGLERDPLDALQALEIEMERFSEEFAAKRSVVVLNKLDIVEEAEAARLSEVLISKGYEVLSISAAEGRGLPELKRRLHALVLEERDSSNSKPEGDGTKGDANAASGNGVLLQAALAQYAQRAGNRATAP